MGWLIEALANAFLEILGDMMSWTVGLVTNLSLDIGMPDKTTVPSIGTLIDPMAKRQNLLESLLPNASSFTNLFLMLAYAIILFMIITKLMVAMGGPFTRSEEPGVIVVRGLIATVGTTYSYSIFVLIESLFNRIYKYFMTRYGALTANARHYSLGLGEASSSSSTTPRPGDTTAARDAYEMFSTKLIKSYQWGEGVGVTIIEIILFTILLIAYFRLVLEIYERYVMLGVLFFTSPLAFATIVSKQMNVFSAWVTMVISEIVVMCSNLFFTGVFITGWNTILTKAKAQGYVFKDPQSFITTMFIMISWLIIGQQFDQHLKGLGLSTAQTGQGLGGAVMAGFGTAVAAGYTAIGAVRTAGDVASGNTGIQRSIDKSSNGTNPVGNPIGTFVRSREIASGDTVPTKSEGRRLLEKAESTTSETKAGQQAYRGMQGVAGKSNVSQGVSLQTKHGGPVDEKSLNYKGGLLKGTTAAGESFILQNSKAMGDGAYTMLDIGERDTGVGIPLTREETGSYASDLVSQDRSLPSQLVDENAVTHDVYWNAELADGTYHAQAYYKSSDEAFKGKGGTRDIVGLTQTGQYLPDDIDV